MIQPAGVTRALCRLVLRLVGVRVAPRGAVPPGPALLIANHIGWLDIVAVLAQHECAFVAKREVRSWPVVGPLAARLGVVFVDRARRRDLLTSIPALTAALRAGQRVLLFAEGTTGDGQALLPFKSALVEAAVRAEVPVVPLAIRAHAAGGDVSALAWVGDETLVANLPRVRALRGATVTVHVAPALPPGSCRKRLTTQARDAIARRIPSGAIGVAPRPTGEGAPEAARWRQVMAALLRPLAAIGLGGGLLYLAVPRYEVPAASPFAGPAWYNPYAPAPQGGSARWWRMNLHAHGVAWGGLTNGAQTTAQVVQRYRALGTDIVGISNYHEIVANREPGVFPVYEHGWNVRKAHHLVIGVRRVTWFDLPFGGGGHAQQYVVDRLRQDGGLIALVHPALRGARSAETLAGLSGYDLLEILNHFLPPADSLWDAVLTAGRPVWLLAGDDSHDTRDPGETGTNFTAVLAPDTSVAAVLTALARGATVGVRVTGPAAPPRLQTLRVRSDTLVASVEGPVDSVLVVADSGRVVRVVMAAAMAAANGARQLALALPTERSYVRLVVDGPGGRLYTNPVVRWNGRDLPRATGTIDGPGTARWRGLWALVLAWAVAAGVARRPPIRSRPGRPVVVRV